VLTSRLTKKTIVFLLASALLLTACQGQIPAPAPTEIPVTPVPTNIPAVVTPMMKVAPEVCAAASASPSWENLPVPASRSQAVLGGGVLDSESINLVAWLYCDEALSPAANGPDYSAIEGLGIHMAWYYTGETLPGPVEYFIGPVMAPQATTGMSGDLIRSSSAAFTGGIYEGDGALTEAIDTVTPFTYQMQIKTGGEVLATGDLTFTLLQTETGLQPAGIFFKAVTP
jgi:hypothetical protein